MSLKLTDLSTLTGQEIAVSDWITVDQRRIDQFAAATGDHQFIHTDPEKAAQGPFGTTVAHGFLALSMLAGEFLSAGGMPDISGAKLLLNYGLNRVRFITPMPVGCRLRSRATLQDISAGEGFWQLTVSNVIEMEGASKPACTAESVFRVYV